MQECVIHSLVNGSSSKQGRSTIESRSFSDDLSHSADVRNPPASDTSRDVSPHAGPCRPFGLIFSFNDANRHHFVREQVRFDGETPMNAKKSRKTSKTGQRNASANSENKCPILADEAKNSRAPA
jgi:hypothetical protein